MIIETIDDYVIYRKETKYRDVLIAVIPEDDTSIHAAASKLSIIFVKDLETDKTYTFSFNHPDCLKHIDLDMFRIDLPIDRRVWCFDKKSSYHLLPIKNYIDVDLLTHLQANWILDRNESLTAAHKLVQRNNYGQRNINKAIPLLKHKEMFDDMCDRVRTMVSIPKVSEIDHGFWMENNWVIQTLTKLEQTGIHVNPECFKYHFPDAIIHDNNLVYSQYNVYTSTGRPSNRFDNVNYAALNKNDGARKCFTSRFGENGKMVLIDYSAFHPRIISYLIKFPLGINTDIYEYLGELYFNRKVTEYDMDEIKSITMRQFYGEIEEKYYHIKYLAHAKEFKERYWKDFQKDGQIKTPLFRRVITNKHLLDPNINKLFNYILQATETEVAITALMSVIDYLKPFKTKAVLYTYDSILFDFYKDESKDILPKIVEIMKMGNRFPIKIYEGDSYDSVAQISP